MHCSILNLLLVVGAYYSVGLTSGATYKQSSCKDADFCANSKGECDKEDVHEACPKMCGLCGSPPECKDKKGERECKQNYDIGFCHAYPNEMFEDCQQTCGICEGDASCPEGWEARDGRCYNVQQPMIYNAARSACMRSSIGSDLVRIDSDEKTETVKAILKDHSINISWIGLTVSYGRLCYSNYQSFDASRNYNKLPKDFVLESDTSMIADRDGLWSLRRVTELLPAICERLPYGYCNNKCGQNAYCNFNDEEKQYECVCYNGYYGDPYQGCQTPCHCSAYGDPHYYTFDNTQINFMGTCLYMLVKTRKEELKDSSCHVKVLVRNEDRRPWDVRGLGTQLSWTKFVEIRFRKKIYHLMKDSKVKIDGELVHDIVGDDVLSFTDSGVKFTGPSECGLMEVSFTDNQNVDVFLSRSLYSKKVKGICGDCNGKSEDDYITKNNKNVISSKKRDSKVGNSWKIESGDEKFDESCKDMEEDMPKCNDNDYAKAKTLCGKMMDKEDTVFGNCTKEVTLNNLADGCIYDGCGNLELMEKKVCAYYASAARLCREGNIEMPDWREMTNCPMDCPENSEYMYYLNPHGPTCADPKGTVTISATAKTGDKLTRAMKREGCQCKSKFYRFGKECIKHCGCTDEETGAVYKVGDSWISQDCSKQFRCESTQNIQSRTYKCTENAECKAQDGTKQCYCKGGYRGDGVTSCIDIDECTDKLCVNNCGANTICENTDGSYECICKKGFQPTEATAEENHSLVCKNIDECSWSENPCPTHATCKDTFGSYRCKCVSGYKMVGEFCEDIDECKNKSICSDMENSHCEDREGSYQCVCNKGFQEMKMIIAEDNSNLTVCKNIDECKSNPCKGTHEVCVDEIGDFSCDCAAGFNRKDEICEDINECIENRMPCLEHGICVNTTGSYKCLCEKGYQNVVTNATSPSEEICEDINECTGNVCRVDHAICSNNPGSYSCECELGYTGNPYFECEPKDPCKADLTLCGNNAICEFLNQPDMYICKCKEGYEMKDNVCVNIDECSTGTDNCDKRMSTCEDMTPDFRCKCKSGTFKNASGVCIDIDECKMNTSKCQKDTEECLNEQPSYTCICKKGYSRDKDTEQCMNINECASSKTCAINMNCIDSPGSYECVCNQGFTKKGGECFDIDECVENNKCSENAICSNLIGNYRCTCKEGYFGNGFDCRDDNVHCKTEGNVTTCDCAHGYILVDNRCVDIDECSNTTQTNGCHAELARCINTAGSYTCACKEGYCGDGFVCHDENECDQDSNICHANANCFNTKGSFQCKCNSGYRGDGITCRDINECEEEMDLCENAICTNTMGAYMCTCIDGYQFEESSKHKCVDIDECASKTLNNCKQTCINVPGAYKCGCNDGYNLLGNICYDKDECVTSPCQDHASCKNTEGSYICSCNFGYRADGDVCVNIDECKEISPCNENAKCEDNGGSYKCTCNAGFDGDGITCTDINECMTMSKPCDENSDCSNTEGSYNCICNYPYYSGDGKPPSNCTINLIDECETKSTRCQKNQHCKDETIGYSCLCNDGYISNDNITCADINECTDGTFTCGAHSHCSNTLGSFECLCDEGFEKEDGECTDVNECSSNLNRCNQRTSMCQNKEGSYECNCNSGYEHEEGNNITCIDIDECAQSQCNGNMICINEPGGFYCDCGLGLMLIGNNCQPINHNIYDPVPYPPPDDGKNRHGSEW